MFEQIRIPIAEPYIDDSDIEAVGSAVSSGWVSGRGKYVRQFEEEFGKWLSIRHSVSCSSGTSALHLALASVQIVPGDEVIIPALSMGAIPFAVSYVGAKSVLVESELETWNMDPNAVEKKLTPKTKAIIAMHTYGHPVNLDPLRKLCNDKRISLIEDAAEAHGAEYRGKKVGTIGRIGCFSFFANKIITTGEGGAIVTEDDNVAEMSRILKDMAFSKDVSKKFLHEYIGFNYRMTNMQAALGSAQLRKVEQFIESRRTNARVYDSLLSKIDGIEILHEATWAKSVYWMYSILVRPEFGINRDKLMSELSKRGIETRPFFVPVHEQPVFREEYEGQTYPVAELLSKTGLNLPSGNTLSEEQVMTVAAAIKSLRQ